MAIIPMQDVLCLDSWARLNTPGVAEGNWAWRYKEGDLTHDLEARLYENCKMFGR
jgi:4-alpha-glucanotransferase